MLKNINHAIASAVIMLLIASPSWAEEASHHGGLPQFNPASWPSQIFWLAVFFTVMYFAFGKSIIPSLGNTIELRTSHITDNIKKAETLSKEAEILRTEIDKAMNSAGQIAREDITSAESTAKANLSSALTEFRSHYEAQIAATEQAIMAAKSAAMIDMEQIVVSLAQQAAEKIAGIPASESGAESVVKSLSQKTKLAA